jgi:hypothetical protein
MRTFAAAVASLATLTIVVGAAQAATVFTGDVIQGTRVVQILHDSTDPRCDGDGCAETAAEYIE